MPLVETFEEYTVKLKKYFHISKELPNDIDIQNFIDQYDLFKDWYITISDVKQDIDDYFKLIIKKSKYAETKKKNTHKNKLKNVQNKISKRRVATYDGYLIVLKNEFGNITSMPNEDKVARFIDRFNLYNGWGITYDLVRDDIYNAFLKGKFYEMFKDARINCIPKVIYTPRSFIKNNNQITNNKINNYKSKYKKYDFKYKDNENVYEELTNKKNDFKKNNKKYRKQTFLIDGDNHFDEGKKGIECKKKDVEIIAYFSQEGAYSKFSNKYRERPNVKAVSVKPGPQAVDNRIKTRVGQLLSEGNQDITIVSQDKGYNKYIKKNNGKNNNLIKLAKSVK